MKDVAEHAGVSTTTVSHIINNSRKVSDELKERVYQAIRELEYRPYGLARSLRQKSSRTFGLLIPDNTNPYFAEIARFIENACFKAGYSLIICNTEQDPKKELTYLDLLASKGVDGLIFVSTGSDQEAIESLSRQKIPSVLVDRNIPGLLIDSVMIQNCIGGTIATEYLIKLGHRRIGCIAGPSTVATGVERLNGYRQALVAAGISIDKHLIQEGNFQLESGAHALRSMLAGPVKPTAVFACNDLMALGAIHAIEEAGLKVPDDISIIGFDDIQLASFFLPPLSTIRQPKDEIGKASVDLLLERIGNSDKEVSRYTLRPLLIERKSCQKFSQ